MKILDTQKRITRAPCPQCRKPTYLEISIRCDRNHEACRMTAKCLECTGSFWIPSEKIMASAVTLRLLNEAHRACPICGAGVEKDAEACAHCGYSSHAWDEILQSAA